MRCYPRRHTSNVHPGRCMVTAQEDKVIRLAIVGAVYSIRHIRRCCSVLICTTTSATTTKRR